MPSDSAATPAAPVTPVALLAAWEAAATPTQVAAQLPYQPALLAWLTALYTQPTHSPLGIPVGFEDARPVLHGAAAIRAARTDTAGPTRATEALRQLRAALPPAASRALLLVIAGPAAPLEMDELSELTEIIHAELLGNEGEMIFGHGDWPALPAGAVQVWLLLGYAASPPLSVQEQLTRIQAEKAEALAREEFEAVAQLRAAEVQLLGQLNTE